MTEKQMKNTLKIFASVIAVYRGNKAMDNTISFWFSLTQELVFFKSPVPSILLRRFFLISGRFNNNMLLLRIKGKGGKMENQKLRNAKMLGGIGSILMLLLPVPTAGLLIAFVGLILVLVAVKYIADEMKDHSVFNNFLYTFIVSIIGVVVAVFIIVLTVFSFAAGVDWTKFQNITSAPQFYQMMQTQGILSFLTSIIIGLLVLWITLIIASYFLRKSYNKIASGTHTSMFHTAGLLYLIGALTAIVLIGFVIIFIAFILQIVAFFSLPENLPTSTASPPPMQQGTPPQP